MRNSSIVAFAALTAASMALAGCQSGSGVDALNINGAPGEEPVKLSELRMYCPQVSLREGTAYFNTYQRGAKDDASKVIYQASISDVTRSCKNNDGALNINVAVAGRIVPGPQGKAGTITMPIRVAVVQGDEVLYSKLHKYPVNVGDTIGATQFVFTDPAIVIPVPSSQNIQVFAGYDEGPYDTK